MVSIRVHAIQKVCIVRDIVAVMGIIMGLVMKLETRMRAAEVDYH